MGHRSWEIPWVELGPLCLCPLLLSDGGGEDTHPQGWK